MRRSIVEEQKRLMIQIVSAHIICLLIVTSLVASQWQVYVLDQSMSSLFAVGWQVHGKPMASRRPLLWQVLKQESPKAPQSRQS